jgi:hypothetical protein
MGGWGSIGSRMRAVERAVAPTGACIVVEVPGMTDDERRQNDALLAEATKCGRQVVRISIGVGHRDR